MESSTGVDGILPNASGLLESIGNSRPQGTCVTGEAFPVEPFADPDRRARRLARRRVPAPPAGTATLLRAGSREELPEAPLEPRRAGNPLAVYAQKLRGSLFI